MNELHDFALLIVIVEGYRNNWINNDKISNSNHNNSNKESVKLNEQLLIHKFLSTNNQMHLLGSWFFLIDPRDNFWLFERGIFLQAKYGQEKLYNHFLTETKNFDNQSYGLWLLEQTQIFAYLHSSLIYCSVSNAFCGTEIIQKKILQIFENWVFIQERILLKRGISFSSKH